MAPPSFVRISTCLVMVPENDCQFSLQKINPPFHPQLLQNIIIKVFTYPITLLTKTGSTQNSKQSRFQWAKMLFLSIFNLNAGSCCISVGKYKVLIFITYWHSETKTGILKLLQISPESNVNISKKCKKFLLQPTCEYWWVVSQWRSVPSKTKRTMISI